MNQLESRKKVAIVIPCYNEAGSIAHVIRQFTEDQRIQSQIDTSIYVIDNNSSDDTSEIAREAGAIVLFEGKKGKGNALRTGFNAIADDIDYVVMLDGDDTYSPKEVLRLIEPLYSDFCDVVIGSRLEGHIQNAAMTKLNGLGNKFFTSAVRALYGANVTDVLTGYFAWKKSALDLMKPHIISQGFAIEMEMITKMARLGLQLSAVPISYHPRTGESSLHPFGDGSRILMMLLRNITWRAPKETAQPAATNGKTTFAARKIVFVSDAIYPYMKGGKEKRLHEISKGLAAMGHDVHIYTMHWWQESDTVKYEHGVYIHALCKHHEMYHGDRRTISEGILFSLACLKLLRVKFDVLDVDHMPFFPIFTTWLVCVLRGRKLYATWHEALSRQEWVSYMGQSGGFLASLVERFSIRLPHHITAASAQTKELLASVHGRDQRVALVASGIDTVLLESVEPADVQCDVLYVGRLVKDKNVDKLIDAVQIVSQDHPAMRCLIVGKGLEQNRLQKQVKRLGLEDTVQFLEPFNEARDIYAYMKAAKVFCSPSVREGFGIVSLEALGCGTPVITSNSPGNAARHLIQNDRNGSVVPSTAEGLAKAIDRWISTSEKPSIAPGINRYDWRELAQEQSEIYSL